MRMNLICVSCGDFFPVYPSRLGRRRYCSRECYNAETQVEREINSCATCGEEFAARPAESRKFCSRECYFDYQRTGGKSNGQPGNGESPNGCHHLVEYRSEEGDCIMCDLERHGAEDEAVKRQLTRDATVGVA